MFYGMTYNEFREKMAKKDHKLGTPFENEYEALDFANKNWLKENEYQGEYARFLVVIDSTDTSKVAFFQFTHYNTCKKFIESGEKINWSDDAHKIWNGDAKMM